MIRFEPITTAALQHALAALSALDQGLVIAEATAALRAELTRRHPAQPVSMPAGHGSARRPCPACSRGVLAPVANREGLRIVGCRLCRYSEVVP